MRCALRSRVKKLIAQHDGLRAAATALKMDPSYLLRLSIGDKTNPSDSVLRKLGLCRVVYYRVIKDKP